ncbi:hypothetical protein [Neobacillus sp. YIM B06451]|uniref:hypothetical protein n=1 Tax=Neobacillus sp. YIM B06451 TaxID=3070994 RepID=UPI00292E1EE6|nr:hypothetical protein [Neobacillus sp. YIM B06451]
MAIRATVWESAVILVMAWDSAAIRVMDMAAILGIITITILGSIIIIGMGAIHSTIGVTDLLRDKGRVASSLRRRIRPLQNRRGGGEGLVKYHYTAFRKIVAIQTLTSESYTIISELSCKNDFRDFLYIITKAATKAATACLKDYIYISLVSYPNKGPILFNRNR